MQNAVTVVGRDALGVNVIGQADDAAEPAVEALGQVLDRALAVAGAAAIVGLLVSDPKTAFDRRSPEIVSTPRSRLRSIDFGSMPGAKAYISTDPGVVPTLSAGKLPRPTPRMFGASSKRL